MILKKAKQVLDGDHYGMYKIKERILEYLAVLKLKGDMKSPILCFAGPPGIGKTSLGRSIAHAIGRKYVRLSLGGLHDESEIRGHRKNLYRCNAWPYFTIIEKSKIIQPGNGA
jgi:ATP-dependent Lon protease